MKKVILGSLMAVGLIWVNQSHAQGFYAVSRVTAMAPARGMFFGEQNVGVRPRLTPSVSTFRGSGPIAQVTDKASEGAEGQRMDPRLLAGIRSRAIQGSLSDQYRMGLVLSRGLNGVRDLKQAEQWFAVAAARNYRPAVVALLHLRRNGNDESAH